MVDDEQELKETADRRCQRRALQLIDQLRGEGMSPADVAAVFLGGACELIRMQRPEWSEERRADALSAGVRRFFVEPS